MIGYLLQILLIIEVKVIISNDSGATASEGTIGYPGPSQHAIGIFLLPDGNPDALPQPIGPVMKLPLPFLHIQLQNPEPGQPPINHVRQLVETAPVVESMP